MEGCRHACATLSFPPVLPETFKTKQNASRANVLSGLRVWFPPNDLNPPHAACARRSLLRSRRSAPLVTVNYFLPAAPPHIWVILLTRVTSPLTNPTLASRAVQGPSSPAAAGRGGMGGEEHPRETTAEHEQNTPSVVGRSNPRAVARSSFGYALLMKSLLSFFFFFLIFGFQCPPRFLPVR